MSVLTSPKTYAGLAVLQTADAVACAIPVPYLTRALDQLGVPTQIRPVLPAVKAASAVGLLAGTRFPALARLTTAALTLYFVLAVGAHLRVRDKVVNTIPSAFFLTLYATMTAVGPNRSR